MLLRCQLEEAQGSRALEFGRKKSAFTPVCQYQDGHMGDLSENKQMQSRCVGAWTLL